jgi:hypothetical protein
MSVVLNRNAGNVIALVPWHTYPEAKACYGLFRRVKSGSFCFFRRALLHAWRKLCDLCLILAGALKDISSLLSSWVPSRATLAQLYTIRYSNAAFHSIVVQVTGTVSAVTLIPLAISEASRMGLCAHRLPEFLHISTTALPTACR